MRVAVNVEQLMLPSPGGVGRYTAKLVSNLVALGVDVHTVVARHTPGEVRSAWAEFDLGSVPEPTVLPLPRAALYDSWHLLDWPALSRRAGIDVLHAPSLAVPPKNGKPLVVSVHDAAPWLFPASFPLRGRWFHHAGMRAASRRADRILTGTEAAASELRAHTSLPAERLRVIPYGVDHPHQEPDPEKVWMVLRRYDLDDQPYVLWVGSLEPRKGLGTLLSAAVKLTQRGSSPTLVLAGYAGWRNEHLITPQDRALLGPALREVGRVGEADLQALYAGASVFAFPSLHEGFGLPVLEAMVAGVPVVASDIPALREVAGDAAVLVPPNNSDAWVEALSRVLESPSLQGELAGAGRRRAAFFSWKRTAEATLAVYEEVAAEQS
ncbi:MAG TPA: glycosyltransferase family 1 protein [Acidimicrobiales bacterium]|nr:glycosyltransferase family 1 protein [Acidimicrobiales bacterium]